MKRLLIALILAALVAAGAWHAWQRGLFGGAGGTSQVPLLVKGAIDPANARAPRTSGPTRRR